MKHTDYNEQNSPNKIFVREDVSLTMIETGDWMNYDFFITLLEKHYQKVRAEKKYDDRPVSIIFCVDDDYSVSLEFWGERLETDEEYENRKKEIEERTDSQKRRDTERLKHLASELGYKLVKK